MAYTYKYPRPAMTADSIVIKTQWFYIDALTLQSFVCYDRIIENKNVFSQAL